MQGTSMSMMTESGHLREVVGDGILTVGGDEMVDENLGRGSERIEVVALLEEEVVMGMA